MASKAKKRPVKARATKPARRKRKGPARNERRSHGIVRSNIAPLVLSGCILAALGTLVFLGYRSVTASDFFEVSRVEVIGTKRSSSPIIERIVLTRTQRSGVWNADLAEIRARIEEQPFVRSASVTRVLPGGIKVKVFEHEPKALVRLKNGDHLVTEDGKILARAEASEPSLPFVLTGWDEARSEKADKENAERVKLYMRMLAEWNEQRITERVERVDINSLREPKAVIQDSENSVSIALGRENFGENLSRGIKAIAGKGNIFEAVDMVGANLILAPRKQKDTKAAAR